MLWTIFSHQMLNHDVLEIIIDIPVILSYKPWQWVLIDYKDSEQTLKRAYSIAEYRITTQGCRISLAIKLNEGSKSAFYLRNFILWDTVEVIGIFWHFVLQETDNPKVFIGTWTGIVPLIAMCNATSAEKTLYFSVSYKNDLFYIDRINRIKNLTTHIHISREQVNWYELWRINLSEWSWPMHTEFYICGNPTVVNSFVDILQSRGYTAIYTEKY